MGNLTNAMPTLGGHTFATPQDAAQAGSSMLPSADSMMGPDVLNPKSDTSKLPPQIGSRTPSFSEASNSGPGGTPNALSKGLTTKGKLLTMLLNAGKGAAAGAGSMTFGQGFEQGGELPFIQAQRKQQAALGQQEVQHGQLENQQLQLQSQYAPQLMEQNFRKTNAEIGKNQAEATKNNAEAESYPARQALEEAQAAAAKYKEVGGMLYDTSGSAPQPVAGQTVPLDQQEAAILGKNPGDRVPIEIKNKANEMKNRGVHITSAGGRQIMVDSQGTKIKDLGAATPVVVNQLNNNPDGGKPVDPNDPNVQAVANGRMKIADVLTNRTPVSQRREFLKAVQTANPQFNSSDYDVEKGVAKDFTSGPTGKQLTAIATAREHMKTFKSLADALDNGDVQKLNQLGNAFGVQFGSDKKTNFDIAAHAFGGEVGKALDGAGVTAGERAQAQSEFNSAMSNGQFKGAIETVDQLLAGKQKAAKQSYTKGRQAQPNFGDDSNGGTPPATDPFAAFGGKAR